MFVHVRNTKSNREMGGKWSDGLKLEMTQCCAEAGSPRKVWGLPAMQMKNITPHVFLSIGKIVYTLAECIGYFLNSAVGSWGSIYACMRSIVSDFRQLHQNKKSSEGSDKA